MRVNRINLESPVNHILGIRSQDVLPRISCSAVLAVLRCRHSPIVVMLDFVRSEVDIVSALIFDVQKLICVTDHSPCCKALVANSTRHRSM
ncbi:unnamed protein product [Pieris brassicae]|uniref:Uncharacterized protein n=1 Tax=Pieris brassicae TaxID=7116 RepID=A0A9P0TJP7_PIEBR|nr:unnamed protein product [Pieris brassicae]